MEAFSAARPARIVVVSGDANAIEPRDSVEQQLDVSELPELVLASHEPAWQQGDSWVLRRVR